jgi:hypothetical protein
VPSISHITWRERANLTPSNTAISKTSAESPNTLDADIVPAVPDDKMLWLIDRKTGKRRKPHRARFALTRGQKIAPIRSLCRSGIATPHQIDSAQQLRQCCVIVDQ